MYKRDIKYNSEKDILIIPEYGRHIQNIIEYIKTIEDKEEQQAVAETTVKLMMQINPQSANLEDYQEKLWKHFFRISNYELDVVPPDGIVPTLEDYEKRPSKVPYPVSQKKFRHYGYNIHSLIKKASEMDENHEGRRDFIQIIASYMKLAHRTWAEDQYVSNDVIKSDLETLSDGRLTIDETFNLDPPQNREQRDYKSSPRKDNYKSRKRVSKDQHSSGHKKRYSNSGGYKKY